MKLRYIPSLLLLATASILSAQNLSKEITIEKEVVPLEHKATRIDLSPSVTLHYPAPKRLSPSESGATIKVPATAATLEPADSPDTIAISSHRGYVALGYMPLYNTALSAGYRFVDKNRTTVGAWLQYDGNIYDGTTGDNSNVTLRNHTATLSINAAHQLNSISRIDADLHYTLSYYKTSFLPVGSSHWDGDWQTVNNIGMSAMWKSAAAGIDYNVGIGYSRFAYAHDGHAPISDTDPLKPVRENIFSVSGSALTHIDDDARLAIGLDASFLDYNRSSSIIPHDFRLTEMNDEPDYGVISLTPHYFGRINDLSARIGARLDIGIGMGKALRLAPDVEIDWTPTQLFAAFIHLAGGEHLNTLSSLWQYDRYTAPMLAYARSSVPLTIDAGAVIGRWRGASFKAWAGYSIANDWLMPNSALSCDFFSPVDLKGWHAGVEAAYSYRDIASLKVTYETAPQRHDRGYYLWRDRARHVMNASLTVRPTAQFNIDARFEMRTDRRIIDHYYNFGNWEETTVNQLRTIKLGDISNLSLGVAYSLNESTSLYGRIENILDHKYMLNANIPAQGITGLLGATYRF